MSECLICMNPLVPPVKVFHCGHSFCTPCVEALIANSRTPRDLNDWNGAVGMVPLPCPTCRTATYLPRRNRLHALPTNHELNEILLRKRRENADAAVADERNAQRNETVDGSAEIDNQLNANMLALNDIDDENSHYETIFETTIGRNEETGDVAWRCQWCRTVNYEFRTNCRFCTTERPTVAALAFNNEWGGAQRVSELNRRLRSNGNGGESFWKLL